MKEEASCRVYLLGPPSVQRNGKPVRVETRKAVALLALLAARRRSHSRASLITLLWPDADESHGRSVLRRTVYALSRMLPDGSLFMAQDQIQLSDAPRLWVDLVEFDKAYQDCARTEVPCSVCGDVLKEAIALYRDDFLAGFTLKDSVEFDDWQFSEAEALRRQYGALIESNVRCLRISGDFKGAIEAARSWEALDTLDEKPQAALMTLLELNGHHAAALRQFNAYRELLKRELDEGPSPALKKLHEDIASGLLSAPEPEAAGNRSPNVAVNRWADRRPATVAVLRVHEESRTDEEMARFMSSLYGLAMRYGGRIEQHTGRSVMVVFGRSATRENAPELAVRAVIDARALAGLLQQHISAGVSSGVIEVPSDETDQPGSRIVSGPAVNESRKLAARATAGEILVSESTFRTTRKAFHYSTLEVGDRRGTVYKVDSLRILPEKSRGIEGLRAPLVGRERELATLLASFDSVRAGTPRIAMIVGEAGIGKSRLVAEALQVTRRQPGNQPLVLEGRCLDLGVAAGYWPFIDIFRQLMSLRSQGEAIDEREVLEQSVGELEQNDLLTAGQASEIKRYLAFLLTSSRVGVDGEEALPDDPHSVRANVFSAVRRFLFSLARLRPTLLVLEDLHWADSLSLDLLDYMMETLHQSAGEPLFLGVVCVFRLEESHRSRHLTATARRKCPVELVEISLRELSLDASVQLTEALLASRMIPHSIREDIVGRAQGNPFFLEEIVRSLIESGSMIRTQAGWEASGALNALAVPDTVERVIRASTDRLPADAQRVLRAASVFGRVFDETILKAAVGANAETALRRLEDRGLIFVERTAPRREYSFRHVLTREAVYRGIQDPDREQLHRRAAEQILREFGKNVQPYLEQLAHHYEAAGMDLVAVDYLLQAGRKAIRAGDNEAAMVMLNHGLSLLRSKPQKMRPPGLELELLINLGVPVTATTGYGSPATRDVYKHAVDLAPSGRTSSLSFAATYGLWRYFIISGDITRALDLSHELIVQADELKDGDLALEGKRALGCTLVHAGRLTESDRILQDGLALYDPTRHRSNAFLYGHDPATTFLSYLAQGLWFRGFPDRALMMQRQLRVMLAGSTHRLSIAYSLSIGTIVFLLSGHYEEALRMADEGVALARDGRFLMFSGIGEACGGWAMGKAGRVREGIEALLRGIAECVDAGCTAWRASFRCVLAELYLADGLTEEARRQLDAAERETEGGERPFVPEIYRLRAHIAHACHDTRTAQLMLKRAMDEAGEIGALSLQLRTAMSMLRLAQAAGAGSRRQPPSSSSGDDRASRSKASRSADTELASSCRTLRRVYDQFTEGFDTADLKSAALLLSECEVVGPGQ